MTPLERMQALEAVLQTLFERLQQETLLSQIF